MSTENIFPNRVQYSTYAGTYWTIQYVKVSFCMPKFSNIKIITHWYHVKKKDGDTGIVYGMTIGKDITVKLRLIVEFKRNSIALKYPWNI